MQDLFQSQEEPTQLIREPGELLLFPDWLSREECREVFFRLRQELNWQTETLHIYGREVLTPRLTAWYGEPEARYRYSGRQHLPRTWHPVLLDINKRLNAFLQTSFNSVLANNYRDGHDCMGWHADAEPELGASPCIASLSLGASRFFDIRRRQNRKHQGPAKSRIVLHAGSLLVMRGEFQQYWQHQVPRQLRIKDCRINLTYRSIQPTEAVK